MGGLIEHPQLEMTIPEKVPVRGWLVVGGCFAGVLMGPALVASIFRVFFAVLLESRPCRELPLDLLNRTTRDWHSL